MISGLHTSSSACPLLWLTLMPSHVPSPHLRTPEHIPVRCHNPSASPTPGTDSSTLPVCKPVLTALIITALIAQLSHLCLIRLVRFGARCRSNINEGWHFPPRRRLTPAAVSGTGAPQCHSQGHHGFTQDRCPLSTLSPPRELPGHVLAGLPPRATHHATPGLLSCHPCQSREQELAGNSPFLWIKAMLAAGIRGLCLFPAMVLLGDRWPGGSPASCISTRTVLTWFCNGALNCGDGSVGTEGTGWYNVRGHWGRSHGYGSPKDASWHRWQWSHHEHPWVLPWLPCAPAGEMLWGRGSAPLLSPLPAPTLFALPRACLIP